jgi:hypothetical protein
MYIYKVEYRFVYTYYNLYSNLYATYIYIIFGYGSKLGTPKLWMVNTKLDFHICGLLGLPY